MREFEVKVLAMAMEKHEALHWEYQEAMKDHREFSLRDVLQNGQEIPEDLRSSMVHQMTDDVHVLLCVSTFKRSFQLKESLPMNVAQTWPWRNRVTWCIFDANPDEDLLNWAFSIFAFAMQVGHVV